MPQMLMMMVIQVGHGCRRCQRAVGHVGGGELLLLSLLLLFVSRVVDLRGA